MKWYTYYLSRDVTKDVVRYCNINGILTETYSDIALLSIWCREEECGKINMLINDIYIKGKGAWHTC